MRFGGFQIDTPAQLRQRRPDPLDPLRVIQPERGNRASVASASAMLA